MGVWECVCVCFIYTHIYIYIYIYIYIHVCIYEYIYIYIYIYNICPLYLLVTVHTCTTTKGEQDTYVHVTSWSHLQTDGITHTCTQSYTLSLRISTYNPQTNHQTNPAAQTLPLPPKYLCRILPPIHKNTRLEMVVGMKIRILNGQNSGLFQNEPSRISESIKTPGISESIN